MNYLEFIEENNHLFEDFITRSTYNSNAIEGNTLSMNETYALLFNSNHCNIENASPREIYEAINHKKILTSLLAKIKNKELLTKDMLININQTINENIIYVGGYRLEPIRIIGSEKKFPMPLELENVMSEFIISYNNLLDNKCSMLDIANMHLKYENIHPFPDGNGRTGRLLINYLLLYRNECPIVIPVSKRQEYLEFLEQNDVNSLAKLLEELQQNESDRIKDFK